MRLRTVVKTSTIAATLFALYAVTNTWRPERAIAAVPSSTSSAAAQPDALSDHIAYGMLFQILAGMPEGLSGRPARAFMRHMGLGKGCKTCDAQTSAPMREPDIDAFSTFLDGFGRELNVLDSKAGQISGLRRGSRTQGRTPQVLSEDAREQLRKLGQEKKMLVDKYISLLPSQVGPDTMGRIKVYVDERFRPRIRVK